jgi:uncharacterized protein with NRDE domain
MCLIVFDWQPAASQENSRALLTLSANRDEFLRRDAEPMHWWNDAPGVLAGRDLTGGGTWLGDARHARERVSHGRACGAARLFAARGARRSSI